MPVIKMVVIIPNSTLHSVYKKEDKIHDKSNKLYMALILKLKLAASLYKVIERSKLES